MVAKQLATVDKISVTHAAVTPETPKNKAVVHYRVALDRSTRASYRKTQHSSKYRQVQHPHALLASAKFLCTGVTARTATARTCTLRFAPILLAGPVSARAAPVIRYYLSMSVDRTMSVSVKLVSAEGFVFQIDRKAACVSNTIRNMLTSQGVPSALRSAPPPSPLLLN